MAMNTVTVLENSDGVSGLDHRWLGTEGVAHVAIPQNAFGTVSTGEVDGTGTAANTTYYFPNGLNGVTISNAADTAGAYTAAQDAYIYVAFNNSALNDVTTAGYRIAIPPNSSMPINFMFVSGAGPKPTEMTLRVTNATGRATFVAVEN